MNDNAKKRQENNQARLASATDSLQRIARSDATPSNIRRRVREAIVVLKKDTRVSVSLRAANAVSLLSELGQHPDISSFSRVMLWSAISELESIRE